MDRSVAHEGDLEEGHAADRARYGDRAGDRRLLGEGLQGLDEVGDEALLVGLVDRAASREDMRREEREVGARILGTLREGEHARARLVEGACNRLHLCDGYVHESSLRIFPYPS